jgi:hypothetical protein
MELLIVLPPILPSYGLGGGAPFLSVVRLQTPLLLDVLTIKYREDAAGFSKIAPAKAGTPENG